MFKEVGMTEIICPKCKETYSEDINRCPTCYINSKKKKIETKVYNPEKIRSMDLIINGLEKRVQECEKELILAKDEKCQYIKEFFEVLWEVIAYGKSHKIFFVKQDAEKYISEKSVKVQVYFHIKPLDPNDVTDDSLSKLSI